MPRMMRAPAPFFLVALTVLSCTTAPQVHEQHPPREEPPTHIILLGTSDLHGHLDTLPLLGGYVDVVRRGGTGVVLLDAGDMFQGTLESNLGEGAAVISAYRAVGYDAVTIGNHEFDYGPVGPASIVAEGAQGPDADPRGALKARAADAKGAFPFLAANLLEDGKTLGWVNVLPSTLVEKQGVSVGLIGVTTIDTLKTTIAANVVGIEVTPLATAITSQAKELRARGARLVFVAAHAGGECKALDDPKDLSTCDNSAEIFEVARQIAPGTVDAIVAGHTHKSVAQEVNGIAIIQSGAYGAAIASVDFELRSHTPPGYVRTIWPPRPLTADTMLGNVRVQPSPSVAQLIQPAIDLAAARRNEPLGVTLDGPFPTVYRAESALGNLVASLLLESDPTAQIGITNAGGLRADLPPGALSYGKLYDTLPFDNRTARLTMKGQALREIFRKNLSGKRGILSIAGARVVASCSQGDLAINILFPDKKKGERPLLDDETVVVVTNEFLATGGDDFGRADKLEMAANAPPFRDNIAARLRARGGTLKPEDWLVAGKPRVLLPTGSCGVVPTP